MKNTRKKGFTIVELVIVIAVIAILAAVLIPTFSNIINKAKQSADNQLIKNLNTALTIDSTTNGKHSTMQSALDAVFEAGYDVAQINANKTDNEILWDSKNDVFCYFDNDKGAVEYIPEFSGKEAAADVDYFVIKDVKVAGDLSDKYSNYLRSCELTEITTDKGLDVGNTAVTTINYNTDADQSVIIRTNGGTLNVGASGNTAKGQIWHYGTLDTAIVYTEITCFHTHGTINYMELKAGKAIAEANGIIYLMKAESATAAAEENGGVIIIPASATSSDIQTSDLPTGYVVTSTGTTQPEGLAVKIANANGFSGSGTQSDPFLIYDYETMQKISSFYDMGYYYFKVKDGVSEIDCSSWIPVKLNGSFDGNGVALNNLDKGVFDCVDGETSTIKNFTINANISGTSGVGAVVYDSNTLNLTIDSVNVHGTLIGATWVTPYVEFGPGPAFAWNLTIKNCVSDATLVATSGSASGFVGHPYDDVSNGSVNGASLITIIDSAYIGNMSATGNVNGSNFKYFTINGNDNRIKTQYSDKFISKLGMNPEGTLYNTPADASGYPVIVNSDGSKTFLAGNYGKNGADVYKPTDKKAALNKTAQSSLPSNIGDVFTINKVAGASKAFVSLQIAPNDKNNYGSYVGTYMSEEIDLSGVDANSTFTSETIKYFTINVNSGVTSQTGLSGNIFNVVNPAYGKNAYSSASVQIVQIDNNNNVLNITSIQIAGAHAAE